MKNAIPALALTSLLVSAAPPRYAVTVTISPAQADANIYLINANGKNADSCGNLKGPAPVLKCQIPAGNYKLSVYSEERTFEAIESRPIKITGKANLVIPVKISTRELSAAGRTAFNKLVIATNGTVYECNERTVARDKLCAKVAMPFELFKRWVSLTPEVKQVGAWTRFADAYYANVLHGGQKQNLFVIPQGDTLDVRLSMGWM